MSGPRDTRDSAEQAGTPAVPSDSAPPSFGGAVPPADPPPADAAPSAGEAEPTASASLRLPAFGLQAPWWAAESSETAPPAEGTPTAGPVTTDPVTTGTPAEGPVSEETPAEAPDDEVVFGAEPAADDPPGPGAVGVPPGTLVAGVGVPTIDSRRAVPAEPIVKRPLASGDTDPDGFPAIRPEDDAPADDPQAGADAEPPGSPDSPDHDTTEDEAAVDETVVKNAAEDRPSEAAQRPEAPAAPEEAAEPSAFEKARHAEDTSAASPGPVLEPDAILPVGVAPPTGSGPFPQSEPPVEAAVTAEQAAVIAPVYHTEGGVPLDTPPPPGPPPQGTPKSGGGGKRRPLLIGGGAAVILAAAVALFTIGGTGSSGEQAADVKATESPAAAEPKPTPADTQSPAPPIPTTGVDITDERADTEPLAFKDVFPTGVVKLGGRTFTLDRWSLNREVSYAARGSMLQVLKQEKCRKIIRATFVDRSRSLAVTSGIAVMPTKESALRVSQAGDPARYEWFRGMGSKHNPDLDRAGGYAAATVRGRYVAYAYVQWANGKNAQPGDPVIKQAAQQFLDYDLRPIMARARG
ncbi:hypothetical protein [Spirillospora sp. NPDC048819]|uniref:hypothetical protein n=1 Tax=Spirillospora sp. NPDC048819 TaxID=3155268 RepID=UPI0033E5B9F9